MAEPDIPRPGRPEDFTFERVRYTKADGVATVVIDRPQVLNAFDFPTLRELSRAFEDAAWDDAVAAVVVTGSGDRAFCTGADLNEQSRMGAASGQYWRWMGAFVEMHDRLRNIGKPTIARINGICVGGGNELQMACDLSVIVDDAYIRHVGPEHGSVPAGGATQWLPIFSGDRRAREILMLCERISPQQALEWGLVNRVVPRSELDAAVGDLTDRLRRKLPETIRYTKQQLNFWRDLSWSLTIGHARDWLAVHSGSAETREAVSAFHEKRPPDFEGLRRALVDVQSGGEAPTPGNAGSEATRRCEGCSADIPVAYAFCGFCGATLGEA